MDNQLALPGTVTPTSLTLSPNLTFEEWEKIGHTLYQIHDGVLWWLGDWILAGEKKWGEKYTQALRETDYEIKTLRNIAYIAHNYLPEQRHDRPLTWSHHYAVASLPAKPREDWLSKAQENEWSISRMKDEIRKASINIPSKKYEFFMGEEIALHGIRWRVEWWDDDRITLIKADMWGKEDNKEKFEEIPDSFTVDEAERVITGQSIDTLNIPEEE